MSVLEAPVAPTHGTRADGAATTAEPPRHRGDIQGLRGIAVLLVVAFHAGIPGFAGGFIGVDVFFVISGFVIGQSLLRELRSTGTVRLRSFWYRRARRLIPAFATMMLTTLLMGIAMLQLGPVQVQATKTALAGTFSVANLFLENSGGSYFGVAEEHNSYLHLWSLGVEEQFYVVLPLLVIGAVLAGRNARWTSRSILVGLLVTGSMVSLWWSQHLIDAFDQRGAFYLPTTRFWEMAIGVLLACLVRSGRWTPVLGVASVAALCWVLATYSAATPFPGVAAVPVVAASAGIIAAAPATNWLRNTLSSRPLAWIGDRSYGWYLWHWPLIVMARQTFDDTLAISVTAASIALIPTALSYRFIERPVLSKHDMFTPPRMAIGAAASVAVLSLTAVSVSFGANAAWGVPLPVLAPDGVAYTSGCHGSTQPQPDACEFAPPGSERGTIMLVGDSHAASVADGVIDAANSLGYIVVVSTHNACPFVMVDTTADCARQRERTMDTIRELQPSMVVMAHNSLGYPEAANGSRPLVRGPDGEFATTRQSVVELWGDGLARSRTQLATLDIPLVSIDVVPIFERELRVPTLLNRHIDDSWLDQSRFESWRQPVLDAEHAALATDNWIDPVDVLCSAQRCRSIRTDGVWLYFDGSHLNRAGSLELSDHIAESLARIINSPTSS